MRRGRRAAGALLALSLAPAALLAPAAGAEPSAVGPFDHTGAFTTPISPGAWTTDVNKPLILSPHGADGRIECTAFHGVRLRCTQWGPDGVGHDLLPLVSGDILGYRVRELWVWTPASPS